MDKDRFIKLVPPPDRHYPMTGKDLLIGILFGIIVSALVTMGIYLLTN